MNRKKMDEWKRRFEEMERCCETVTSYCRKHSLSMHEGYYWKRKIRNLHELQNQSPKECLTEIVFAAEKNESSGLKVSFGNGIEIIPEKGFSEYEFMRIAALLRSF